MVFGWIDDRDLSASHLTFRSLESVRELLEEIFDDALVVVAPAEDVVECREAMGLTSRLLMVKLFGLEFVVADNTPVVTRCVHGETRREGSVNTNDH